jgi:hypothetical protein
LKLQDYLSTDACVIFGVVGGRLTVQSSSVLTQLILNCLQHGDQGELRVAAQGVSFACATECLRSTYRVGRQHGMAISPRTIVR